MKRHPDTVFALSSGTLPAAIGIVRISGPKAIEACKLLTYKDLGARKPSLLALHDSTGLILDRALVIVFPGPGSATGEDLVELHCHGGRAVMASVLNALGDIDGLRPADPGEFTRRALENDRIDLIEAEGLADLLMAETESQRRQAIELARGGLSATVGDWQDAVLGLAARCEAMIDFSDEDDVDAADMARLGGDIGALAATIGAWLERPSAERLRDGISVVIAGPPNAGKSTLLNAIVQRDAAIISDQAGTTRDIVEVAVAIDGVPYRFSDTAGLRDDSGDSIENIGMERARNALGLADIVLWLGDDEPPTHPALIRVAAQSDRRSGPVWNRAVERSDIAVSAHSGNGMDRLLSHLKAQSEAMVPHEGEVALNQRQRDAMSRVAQSLVAASEETDAVLMAENLRAAMVALDDLTGKARTEDMLDALFGKFCIGK